MNRAYILKDGPSSSSRVHEFAAEYTRIRLFCATAHPRAASHDQYQTAAFVVVAYAGGTSVEEERSGRYGLDLLSLCGNICEEEDRDHVTEDDVRQAQRIADMMMLVYRAVNKLTSSQKLLLYAIFTTKDTSPTTIYACYHKLISDGMNGSKLTTKWLSIFSAGVGITRIR